MSIRRPLAMAALIAVVAATVTAVSLHHELRAGATAMVLTDVSDVTGVEHRWTPDNPLFVLVLGSDARRGEGCGCGLEQHVENAGRKYPVGG